MKVIREKLKPGEKFFGGGKGILIPLGRKQTQTPEKPSGKGGRKEERKDQDRLPHQYPWIG